MSENKYQQEDTKQVAKLTLDQKTINLRILDSSIGPKVVDISTLYQESGYFTYDPGFMSTASCQSSITYIDGEVGILRYRGYDVKYLCENHDFLDVVYLLMHSNLPNIGEKQKFKHEVSHHSLTCEKLKNLFTAFESSSHPMSMLLSSVGYLASLYEGSFDVKSEDQRIKDGLRIISKVSTISAMIYKHLINQAFIYPNNDLGFTDNFMNMMFETKAEEYHPDPLISKALDKIFILHADHEQNASTSVVRSVGSTNANIYACISSGIAALWGPSHGGANEAVLKMLSKIGDVKNIEGFISKVKDKSEKLMGFGHRVYKSYDPRAEILKSTCDHLLKTIDPKKTNKLLEIALRLEEIALTDEYFVSRKLYPNVDFYSGIIYSAIGIPTNMFTVLFALARTAGWVAQWLEMHKEPKIKISRPRQLYIGT